MRFQIACAMIVLVLGVAQTPVLAQCEDKSQQNAADEATVRGDLNAASKCATQDDISRSEKKLEDAAEKAKGSQDIRSGPAKADGSNRERDQRR